MIKRYKVPVMNPRAGYPSYVLVHSPSMDRAIAYVESFGYLVSGDVTEFG